MIVRESPSPRKPNLTTEWPPKSPRAALATSPSGRKRLEKYYQHINRDGSSMRRSASPCAAEAEEDEETLQLQLKAIEAKLKLKKLQKRKQEGQIVEGASVQVPLSPKRNQSVPAQHAQHSPRRAQLGIDKGLRAEDVSLKSVKNDARSSQRQARPHVQERRQELGKKQSFAERLLASRESDTQRNERQLAKQANQSRSFGVRKTESGSQNETNKPRKPQKTNIDLSQHHVSTDANEPPDKNDIDPNSHFAIKKRTLPPATVNEAVADKVIYSIPHLLKEVHAPSYDPPDVDDYVVMGIIASKSKPREHAQTHQTTDEAGEKQHRSKFMVLRLTDLKWEVDLFLFGSGFDTFYKLTVGTVIAVLNPGIMAPKANMRDSGKFSLKLGSSEDTVLEIGTSTDLGFCNSVKADGEMCGQWIDNRKTEYCEFHVSLQVARSKSSRMEINTMGNFGLFRKVSDRQNQRGGYRGRGGGSRGFPGQGSDRGGGRRKKDEDDSKKGGHYYDREAHSAAYSMPSFFQRGSSTAKLLDADDYGPGAGLTPAERNRKRRAAQEKERDLARALGKEGHGLGVEYLRSKHDTYNPQDPFSGASQQSFDEAKDASSFGLLHSPSKRIDLDPVNGRRSRKEAIGWSKAFKRGLSPTATTGSQSPKKARFVLEGKGLRTPGADSTGGEKSLHNDLDDGDDLELV